MVQLPSETSKIHHSDNDAITKAIRISGIFTTVLLIAGIQGGQFQFYDLCVFKKLFRVKWFSTDATVLCVSVFAIGKIRQLKM